MTRSESASVNTPSNKRRFVTLRAEHSVDEITIEVPADRPVRQLIPDILLVLGWPDTSGEHTLRYEILSDGGDPLDPEETLDQAGIENSDVIWIRLADPAVEAELPDPTSDQAPLPHPDSSASSTPQKDPRRAPAPPVEARIEIAHPSLVSKQGTIYELGEPPLMVGRAGRDFEPDIDLTDLDPEYVSSRRHARIESEKGQLLITALRTTNGLFINGIELTPGSKHALETGDEIQFGFEGVRLSYFEAGRDIPASYFA